MALKKNEARPAKVKKSARHLHLSLIIFLVCLLLTFMVWDHYFNSNDPLTREWISTIILLMGTLFSISTGFLVWTLESGKSYLEKEVERRTEELVEKEREKAAAEARSLEAQLKHKEVEEAYRRLEEVQDQLIQSEKLASLGRVMAGIVHELKTPLITMNGYSNLILKGGAEVSAPQCAEIIERQTKRCLKIVQDLLTFSRHEKIHLRAVDLPALIDKVHKELPVEFKQDGIEVLKQYPEGERTVIQADPDQLERLFVNLFVNSWHALKEHGGKEKKISVRVLTAGNSAQIFFTDNGPGIEKENLGKIFEPFFTTKPAGQGTGLGLSLCSGIVGMHHGKINVQSEAGKGTSFFIELPMELTHERVGKSGLFPNSGSVKKILVVDDDYAVIHFLGELLHAWNYEAVSAETGQQALQILFSGNEKIDLVILDIELPDTDGFEIAAKLRADKKLGKTPIIFLSGKGTEINLDRAEKLAGRGNCLSKPFDYKDLREIIIKNSPAA